jgi:hypothetical protein
MRFFPDGGGDSTSYGKTVNALKKAGFECDFHRVKFKDNEQKKVFAICKKHKLSTPYTISAE